jgi:hypothetical protein
LRGLARTAGATWGVGVASLSAAETDFFKGVRPKCDREEKGLTVVPVAAVSFAGVLACGAARGVRATEAVVERRKGDDRLIVDAACRDESCVLMARAGLLLSTAEASPGWAPVFWS